MIDPKELRIGNWIAGYKGDLKVDLIDEHGVGKGTGHLPNEMNPIILTWVILKQCGFKRKTNSDIVTKMEYNEISISISLSDFSIRLFDDTPYLKGCLYPNMKIKSLHQLQNLYYALTGNELTYKP